MTARSDDYDRHSLAERYRLPCRCSQCRREAKAVEDKVRPWTGEDELNLYRRVRRWL